MGEQDNSGCYACGLGYWLTFLFASIWAGSIRQLYLVRVTDSTRFEQPHKPDLIDELQITLWNVSGSCVNWNASSGAVFSCECTGSAMEFVVRPDEPGWPVTSFSPATGCPDTGYVAELFYRPRLSSIATVVILAPLVGAAIFGCLFAAFDSGRSPYP